MRKLSAKNLCSLFIMIFNLINFSCSPKIEKETQANFLILGSLVSAASSTGGLWIWGKGPEGESFGSTVSGSTAFVKNNLRNGPWSFYAIAYSGPSLLTGTMICGKSDINLAGGEVSVSININNANCYSTPFLRSDLTLDDASAGIKTYPLINLYNCNTTKFISSFSHNAVDVDLDLPCNGGGRGIFNSIKVSLEEFDTKNTAINGSTSSTCLALDENGFIALPSLQIPIGNSVTPFKTKIRGYYTNTCDDSLGSNYSELVLQSGFGALAKVYSNNATGASNDELNVFFDVALAEVCAQGRDELEFASSETGYVIGICNATQFNNLGGAAWGAGRASKHIALFRNINFLNVSNLFSSPTTEFANFYPLGESIGTAASLPYTGHFYGNNFSIENPLYSVHGVSSAAGAGDYWGLFRKLGSGARVVDLTIKNAVVECRKGDEDAASNRDCFYVGMIAGEVSGSKISNVKVHGFVEGYKYVGGIVGSVSNSIEMTNSHASISVEADHSYVGGLVGQTVNASNSLISKSTASVDINSDSSLGVDSYAGGIIGKSSGAGVMTISEVMSKGRISGNRIIGGIAGYIDSSDVITESYSLTSVHAYHIPGGFNNAVGQHQTGGLVGELAGTLSNSFATVGGQTTAFSNNNSFLQGLGGAVGYNNAATATNVTYTGVDNSSTVDFDSTASTANGIGISGKVTSISAIPSSSTFFNIISGEYPRLNFETALNPRTGLKTDQEVPYLRRYCSTASHFNSMPVNNIICTVNQFKSMTSGSSYKLGRDIDFQNDSVANNKVLGAGAWKLTGLWPDGNEYGVQNIKIQMDGTSDNVGIFSSLNAGSEIKNISFSNVIILSTSNININDDLIKKIGLLSSQNAGLIDGVSVVNSGLLFKSISLGGDSDADVATNETFLVGGLVAQNSGTIKKVELESDISFLDIELVASSTQYPSLFVGGIVSKNTSSIESSESRGNISWKSTVANNSNDTKATLSLSSIVHSNSGTINEVSSERSRVEIYNYSSTSTGVVTGFVDNNEAMGIIKHSLSTSSFHFNNFSGELSALLNDDVDISDTSKFYNSYYYSKESNSFANAAPSSVQFSANQNSNAFCYSSGGNVCGSDSRAITASHIFEDNGSGGLAVEDGTTDFVFNTWPVTMRDFLPFGISGWMITSDDTQPPELPIHGSSIEDLVRPGF